MYDQTVPPIYFDTETCGLYGPIVLLQYAIGDGPTILYEPWKNQIYETMKLFEMICNHPGGVVGFNLAFDWFHICQMYTTLALMQDPFAYLEDCVEEYALNEQHGRDGACLKPTAAHDIMLHARTGPYQSTMERGEVRIRKVPTTLAWMLATELERRVPLRDIYFARKKNKSAPRWNVYDIEDEDGDIIPEFKDLVLKFAPSSALKALAADALELEADSILLFADIQPKIFPKELGYAPFCTALGEPGRWNDAWPDCIEHHIDHWAYNKLARLYAEKDVTLSRDLYYHFGRQPLGDDNSELACMVAAVRWKGFTIDAPGMRQLKIEAKARMSEVPTAPAYAKKYIQEVMAPAEALSMKGSTGKITLETIVNKLSNLPCPECDKTGLNEDHQPCEKCGGNGTYNHPAVIRAQQVLDSRKAGKEIELYDKLLRAGRLHASFVIVGTLSSRMAGSDKLNAQGIKNADYVRSQFPLAWPGDTLCGGDFAGFEVVLAEACYNDPGLRKDLVTKRPCHKCTCCKAPRSCEQCQGSHFILKADAKGKMKKEYCSCTARKKALPCARCDDSGVQDRDTPNETWCRECLSYFPVDGCDDCWGTGLTDTKIHALFGLFVYPDMTYEEILANKVIYTRCKSAVFAMLYGGEGFTLKSRLGVEIEVADAAYAQFCRRYPGVGANRQKIIDMFCTLTQPNGIGSKVEWKEPQDYIESMFGFRRYFTLENKIAKALFELANSPPASWKNIKIKVVRRDREQTAMGAVQSALYGATFALQSSNMRAAANHVIQSSGAQITKLVQRKIWDIQPSGVHEWYVQPMNIHDEIMCPTKPEFIDRVAQIVNDTVESLRAKVPLIKIVWEKAMKTWAEK